MGEFLACETPKMLVIPVTPYLILFKQVTPVILLYNLNRLPGPVILSCPIKTVPGDTPEFSCNRSVYTIKGTINGSIWHM